MTVLISLLLCIAISPPPFGLVILRSRCLIVPWSRCPVVLLSRSPVTPWSRIQFQSRYDAIAPSPHRLRPRGKVWNLGGHLAGFSAAFFPVSLHRHKPEVAIQWAKMPASGGTKHVTAKRSTVIFIPTKAISIG